MCPHCGSEDTRSEENEGWSSWMNWQHTYFKCNSCGKEF